MRYSNYSDIQTILESKHLKDFDGNSSAGRWYYNHTEYVVFSYDMLILRTNRHGEPEYFDNRYFSRTTSRLQGIVRRAFPTLRTCTDRSIYYFDIKED
ncbi:MAG: hypothetical protein RBS17_07995 [Coriobacteriia bacterium]|nr:hypothetical protein [Coriobacteriia bacterium]